MAEPFRPKPYQIAEFRLYGKLLEDGRIQIGEGPPHNEYTDVLNEFPTEVIVCGVIYTLEEIEHNEITPEWAAGASAETRATADRIRWGVYV